MEQSKRIAKIHHWLNDESFPLERLEILSEQGYLIPVHRYGERGVMFVHLYKYTGCLHVNIQFQYGDKLCKAFIYDGYLGLPIERTIRDFLTHYNIKYAMGVV